ncbi:hypothetical protein [Streptomyces kronopolitis]
MSAAKTVLISSTYPTMSPAVPSFTVSTNTPTMITAPIVTVCRSESSAPAVTLAAMSIGSPQ